MYSEVVVATKNVSGVHVHQKTKHAEHPAPPPTNSNPTHSPHSLPKEERGQEGLGGGEARKG